MKIELRDYTGAGSDDPWYAAKLLIEAKSTRLSDEQVKAKLECGNYEEELFEVANSVRSSWEFVEFTWKITGVTRACADQILRSRYASFAVQAQRVADMSDFNYRTPYTVTKFGREALWTQLMDAIAETYKELRSVGVPAQDARGLLPMNAHTNLLAKFNLRAFAELVGKRDNLRAQDEYTDVVRDMQLTAYQVMPWLKPFLRPDRMATPYLDAILRDLLGDASPVDMPALNCALKELDKIRAIWK